MVGEQFNKWGIALVLSLFFAGIVSIYKLIVREKWKDSILYISNLMQSVSVVLAIFVAIWQYFNYYSSEKRQLGQYVLDYFRQIESDEVIIALKKAQLIKRAADTRYAISLEFWGKNNKNSSIIKVITKNNPKTISEIEGFLIWFEKKHFIKLEIYSNRVSACLDRGLCNSSDVEKYYCNSSGIIDRFKIVGPEKLNSESGAIINDYPVIVEYGVMRNNSGLAKVCKENLKSVERDRSMLYFSGACVGDINAVIKEYLDDTGVQLSHAAMQQIC